MKVIPRVILHLVGAVIACVLIYSCDPGFITESYIRNISSYSVTVSDYVFEEEDGNHKHSDPITIPSGGTVLFYQDSGLGISTQEQGSAYFFLSFPDGCEITFKDGKKLHFRPVNIYNHSIIVGSYETHSPYDPSSHEFTMLDKGFCSTHGKTTYIITNEDLDRAE